jgi:hypothetical protein
MANMQQQNRGRDGNGKGKSTDRVGSKIQEKRQIVSNPAITMSRGPTSSIRVRNQEALNIIVAGGTTSPYTALNFFRVAPSGTSIGTSWLSAIANQYSMYKFHSVTIKYVPITGTTQSGFFAMGFFPDAEEAAISYSSGGAGTLGTLSQCRKFTQVPLYSEATIKLDPKDFVLDWYYVDPSQANSSESRLTIAGAVGMVTATNSTLTNSVTGVLYLDYDIELKFPVSTNPNVA